MQHYATSSDGTRIGFTQIGQGPKVLIVHGGLGCAEDWRLVAEALAPHRTCFLMDRRGRGASGDADAHSLNLERDDVLAVLAATGSETAVFGHSYGAICALEAALASPVARLILYEPPLHAAATPMADHLQGMIDTGDAAGMVRHFLVNATGLPEVALAGLEKSPFWAGLVARAPTFPREARALERDLGAIERYGQINAPTLLLLGERSPQSFHDTNALLAALLPHARTETLPGQGHAAHRTAPAALAAAVAAFV